MNFVFSGINISSINPEKTFEFYKKLGFKVLCECEAGDKWYGVELALQENSDTPKIWIWRRQPDDDLEVKNLFVFDTGDKLDEIYEQFKKDGISCQPPHTAVWGGKEMMLTDPDGNSLLFL